MEEDKELKEAIEACSKIVNEKIGRLPFMIVISKANVRYATEEHRKKGVITGTATYMYMTRPPLKRDGLSKLLIDTTKVAIGAAEKTIADKTASENGAAAAEKAGTEKTGKEKAEKP